MQLNETNHADSNLVCMAMPRILIELGKNPHLGLLHARTHFGLRNTMVIQYLNI